MRVKYLCVIFFVIFFCFPRNAFSFPKIQMQSGAGFIPSTVTHENGVWRSRPAISDEKISDLLAVNGIFGLEKYALWLKRNVFYKKIDSENHWHLAEDVFSKRSGDCKDYSVLNSAALKLFGYKPVILAIEMRDSGHAICAFELNGRIAFFDNNTLVLTRARTLDEFKTVLFQFYHFTRLIDVGSKVTL